MALVCQALLGCLPDRQLGLGASHAAATLARSARYVGPGDAFKRCARLSVGLAAAGLGLAAHASDTVVYRCPGNVFSSSADLTPAQAREKGCRILEGAPAGVIGGGAPDLRPPVPLPEPVPKPRATPKAEGPRVSYGTAFRVADGAYLTNSHVVRGCTEVSVVALGAMRTPATVISQDVRSDLAAIRASEHGQPVAQFRVSPVRAGEQIVAIGFPYLGLLANEAIVTTGTVSALAGLGNDQERLQIQAPVQPGNSGGPVLDAAGAVVGVVVARLNDAAIAERTGSLPQNVNFAIKGEVAMRFLATAGLQPRIASAAVTALDLSDMVADKKRVVAVVECKRSAPMRQRH